MRESVGVRVRRCVRVQERDHRPVHTDQRTLDEVNPSCWRRFHRRETLPDVTQATASAVVFGGTVVALASPGSRRQAFAEVPPARGMRRLTEPNKHSIFLGVCTPPRDLRSSYVRPVLLAIPSLVAPLRKTKDLIGRGRPAPMLRAGSSRLPKRGGSGI